MNSAAFVTIAFALACVAAAESGVPACNSLKPATLDMQWLIRRGPITMFRSNTPIYECAQLIYVGAVGNSTGNTATGVIIQGNYTFSYDLHTTDNSLYKAVICSNGMKKDFRVVFVNSTSPSVSVCAVICDANDATKYEAIGCGGRTSKDIRDIDDYLERSLKGVKGIKDVYSNCPKPQHCNTFTN